MKGLIFAAATLTCLVLVAPGLHAQSQPSAPPAQSQPADPQKGKQKPPAQAPAEANPFPEDTNNVPVMPSSSAPAADDATPSGFAPPPAEDNDPVRSPEDPAAEPASQANSSSSSFAGMDRLLPPADTDAQGKRGRGKQEPEHVESAKEDESVGNYYLSEHNWKAALSRFESAVVLDPENPEAYWGLGEAQHHLGNLAEAKANYQKVVDYDPDSKHGKEARKLLKDPDLANAHTASASKP
jgi:tetratricopeptide (TPR) repeat protein